MRVKEALERVYALSQMLRNSSEKDLIKYADTRERIQSFVGRHGRYLQTSPRTRRIRRRIDDP